MKHGTRAKYQNGCRCQLCRKAAADYYQRWKETRDAPCRRVYWPLQPLLDAIGPITFLALAEQTGINPRTIHRAVDAGFTDRAADRAATRLGLHPSLIWPDWFDPYIEGAAA